MTSVVLGSTRSQEPVRVNLSSLDQDIMEPIGRDVELRAANWRRTFHWYDASYLATPAFWVEEARRRPRPVSYQVGSNLAEEVALCILGGYGIAEWMASAAFWRVKELGLVENPDEALIRSALSTPFSFPDRERHVRYRFPVLKAQRLTRALRDLQAASDLALASPRELRDWLTTLPGVGPKTASWIVRNRTRSDDIAVVDIHIRRAGLVAGLFDVKWRLPNDYAYFEQAFVAWARLGGVPTADLDACIWVTLSDMGLGARSLLGVDRLADLDQ